MIQDPGAVQWSLIPPHFLVLIPDILRKWNEILRKWTGNPWHAHSSRWLKCGRENQIAVHHFRWSLQRPSNSCGRQCHRSVDSQTKEKKDCLIAGSAKKQSEKTKGQKSFIKHFLIEKKCCQKPSINWRAEKNCIMGGIKSCSRGYKSNLHVRPALVSDRLP